MKSMPMGPDKEFQAEDDCRHLERAGEVMADPKRMKAAQAHAMKKMMGLGRVLSAGRKLRRK